MIRRPPRSTQGVSSAASDVYKRHDYILCSGDPAIIGLSTAIVSDITQGRFNLLKWDRQETRYYPLSFNLFEKGIDDDDRNQF